MSTTVHAAQHTVTFFATVTETAYQPVLRSSPLIKLTAYCNSLVLFVGNLLARVSWKLIGLVVLKIPYFILSSSSIRLPLYISITIFVVFAKFALEFIDKKYVYAYTKKTNKLLSKNEYGGKKDSFRKKYEYDPEEEEEEEEEELDSVTSHYPLVGSRKFNKLFDATNSTGNKFKKKGKSFLSEFLKAIRIFGYLDNDVFNELTKSIKSERLSEGEVLLLNDLSGFVILVEGAVGIYYKLENDPDFSEDCEIGLNDHDTETDDSDEEDELDSTKRQNKKERDKDKYNPNDEFDSHCIVDGEKFQLLNVVETGTPISSLVSILKLFTNDREETLNDKSDMSFDTEIKLPQLIAKTSANCTVAIIPPEAFQKLTTKYPRSASHMIQMILTKLYRITFHTAHKYLGLTKEIMKTELLLNKNFRKITNNPTQLHKLLINIIDNDCEQEQTLKHSANLDISTTSSITGLFGSTKISKTHNKKSGSLDLLQSSYSSNNSSFDYTYKNPEFASSQKSLIPFYQQENADYKWRIPLIEIFFSYLGIDKTNILPRKREEQDLTFKTEDDISVPSFSPQIIHTNGISIYRASPTLKDSASFEYEENSYTSSESIDYTSAIEEFSNALELEFVTKGTTIVKENEYLDGLLYLISGTIEASVKDIDTNQKKKVYKVTSGNMVGFLSSLVGNSKSFSTLKAKSDLYIAFLPSKVIEKLCDKYFMIYLSIAKTLISSLSSRILKLDYAVEWVHLGAAEVLFRKDEPANAIYVVLSGRLREFLSKNIVVNEFVQGQSLGEVEVLTASRRSSTVLSIRDTDLARIPRTLYEYLALEHPSTMFKVSRLVAKQILEGRGESSTETKFVSENGFKYDFDLLIPPTTRDNDFSNDITKPNVESSTSYRTITVLPLSKGLPIQEFAGKLINGFKEVGRTVIGLDQRALLNHLGKHAFDKLAPIKQASYFADLEDTYQTVVYIGDSPPSSSWISTCIAEADCVLFLGDVQNAQSRDTLSEYEKILLQSKCTPKIELILLHPKRYVEPGSTQQWLKIRPFVESYHHIEFNVKKFMNVEQDLDGTPIATNMLSLVNIKNKFIEKVKRDERINKFTQRTSKYIPERIKTFVQHPFKTQYTESVSVLHSHKDDFLRLARILSNQSIGVVLGGGGARGVSHIGVLKALEDQGIPIDVIGGTSMGAFVGGLYAKEYDIVPIYGRVKQFCARIGSFWRLLSDLTLPITSYTTGHEFNKGVWSAFGESRIEDFWLQFYCNSTNITESLHEIHTKGIAWRYIRASMSLISTVPPMVDSNGSMLCDGGYIENVAVQELKRRGCKTIFAVDVGANDIRTKMDYGDYASGFWILFNKWNPFSTHPNVPSITEIQVKLGYISSVNALEKAKMTPGVIYARPPVESIGTLDFKQFQSIYEIGEKYGQFFLKELKDSNKLPLLPGSNLHKKGEKRGPMIQRRNSI